MTDQQRIDLLDILQEDPRTAVEEIATRVGLETADVADAIAAMEQDGTIRGYRAVIDWDRVGGPHIYAFVDVGVRPEPDFGFDAVARRVAMFDEVHSLYLTSGQRDLLVVVEGRDYREVALFVAEKLAPLKGVESTATSFVLRKYKIEGQLLMDGPDDPRLPVAP